MWGIYEIKCAKRLAFAFVHFKTARASLFTDHSMSVSHTSQIQTFENNLWADFRQFSYLQMNIPNLELFPYRVLKELSRTAFPIIVLWSLFSEYCVRTRIIFYNVTSEYNPALKLLILKFQLRILKMTSIHQWRDMNFSAFIPCFIDHFFSCFWLLSSAMPEVSPVFPILSPLLPLHLEFVIACGIWMNLWTRL